MTKAKKKYASNCKQKVVTFYKCDADLLEVANAINFQAFVKAMLRLMKASPKGSMMHAQFDKGQKHE